MNTEQREKIEEIFNKISMTISATKTVAPLYLVLLEDNSTIPIVMAEGKDIDLNDYTELSIKAAQDMGAQSLLFLCEQAVVKKKKNDPCIQAMMCGQLKPSDHPDKEDYLFLYNMESTGDCHSIMAKIHSDPIGTRYTTDFEWVKNVKNGLAKYWEGC